MLRLALLGDYPLTPNRISGGVEYVLHSLAGELAKAQDLDVHVVTLRRDVPARQVRRVENVTAHYLRPVYRFANVTFHLINKFKLWRELAAIQPDVIHAHIAGTYGEVAQHTGKPYVLPPHGIRHREPTPGASWFTRVVRQPLIRRNERHSVRAAKYLTAISPYVMREFGDDVRGQVHLIENPTNALFFEAQDCTQPGQILFAGYLEERKSVHHVIEALALLRERVPHAHLMLLGQPREAAFGERLQAMVKQSGLEERVTFAGLVGERGVAEALSHCAVLVLPSRQETAPTIIQQAMAAGKPVVATRVGGIPDLVADGRTGWLVNYGDVAALANAIEKILQNPALGKQLGQAGRAEAEKRFKANVVAAKTRALYEQIWREAQTRPA
jgi:glycosyltransferase involved in cell wall biosynthesis